MKYQLELQNITKSYGDLKANNDISLSIEPASIHALLGENGAGKSTLVKVIYGSLQADSGQMQWRGEAYTPKSPFEAREQGIAMVFQHFSLFESLSVAENIVLGLDGVVFPEPFGPINPTILPSSTVKEIFSLALTPPKYLQTLSTSNILPIILTPLELLYRLHRQPRQIVQDIFL